MSRAIFASFSFLPRIAILAAAVCLWAPSIAQAAGTSIPSTANPGRIDDRLSSPNLEAPAAPAAPVLQTPTVTSEIPPGADKIHFNFKGVQLEGASVFTEADLHPLYQDLIGKDVTLATMIGVADKITAKYRNAGYILSRAVVPEQTVDNGIVRIQVIEGFISKVNLNGAFKNSGELQAYASHIEDIRPITAHDLERYLLMANDIPGFTVKGVLQRSPTVPGGAELTLMTQRQLVSADASVDNRGSKFLGPDEINLSSSLNDAMGLGEQIGAAYTTTANGELNYYAANGSIGLDSEGTRLSVIGSDTQTKPGFTLKPLDTKGFSDLLGFEFSHPFIRTREENLQGLLRFDGQDVKDSQLGSTISSDKIRSARLGENYQVADTWDGVNTVNGLYSEGFHILGASGSGDPLLSRADGRSDYHKFNLDLQRIQSITPDLNLVLASSGQYAFDDLLTAEQFGVGGPNFGRGYDESEITGDSGIAGKAELQYNYHVGTSYLDTLQPYTFFDTGEVSDRSVLPGEKKVQSLSSTGVGVRLRLTDNFSGQLEIAQPLTKDVATENNKDPRYFFGITAHY